MSRPSFPDTLLGFQKAFPHEAVCSILRKLCWLEGFVCHRCCSFGEPFLFKNRVSVLRCRKCGANIRLTAGTIMQDSRTPLQIWFWGAYLLTSLTPGISATQFQRQLGIKRYETAFQILHKLRMAMIRPGCDKIGSDGYLEIDEAFVGGRTRGEGKGITHKVLVAGAVEVRQLSKPVRKGERTVYAGRLRLAVIKDRGKTALESFVANSVVHGSTIVTDGWQGYDNLKSSRR